MLLLAISRDLFSRSLETHTRQESISFFLGNIWHNNTLSSVSGFQSRLIWDILGPKKTYMGSVLGDMSKKAKGPGAVSVESLKAQLEAPLAAGGRMAWQLQKIHETTNILRVFFFEEENQNFTRVRFGGKRWFPFFPESKTWTWRLSASLEALFFCFALQASWHE